MTLTFFSARAALIRLIVLLLAPNASAAIVRGTVLSTTNQHLSDKVVAAYGANGDLAATGSTDSAGTYALSLGSGDYRLLAYDPAGTYATTFYKNAESFETSEAVTLAASTTLQADFTLARGGSVAGVVSASGSVLISAVVEAYNLSGTRRGHTTAAATGEFSLVLPPGDFKIFAYDANGFYAGAFHSGARAFSEAAPVRVTPGVTGNVSFILEPAARLSGTVVDAGSSLPLAALFVYAYTAGGALVSTTTTDAGGAFRFSLPPGTYRILAGDPARVYAPAFYANRRSFESADVITLAAGVQRTGVILSADRGGTISGRVQATGNLTVAAYNLDGTLHTSFASAADGTYSLLVAPGEYRMAAFDPAGIYATQFYSGSFDFASAATIHVLAAEAVNAVDFTPVLAGRITGTVRNAANLQTLAGMSIGAYDGMDRLLGAATTNASGVYSMAVAPGTYRVLAYDPNLNYATGFGGGAASYEETVPVSVTVSQSLNVDMTMRTGFRVTGSVRDQNGAAVDGVEVSAYDANGNRVAAAFVKTGAFTIVAAPGVYRFGVSDPRHRYATRYYANAATLAEATAVTVSGQTSPLSFTLEDVARRRSVRH